MTYHINQAIVRWRIVDEEAVLINIENTFYYSLNKTGTLIWQLLLERPRPFAEIVGAVATRFRRTETEVGADVRQFLEQMGAENLLTMTGASAE